MLGWLWKLLTDEATFRAAVNGPSGRLKAYIAANAGKIRGMLLVAALGILSGFGPFAPITQWLGSTGYVGSGIMLLLTVLVKGGDVTPQSLKDLAPAFGNLTPDHVNALAQLTPQQIVELAQKAPAAAAG